MNEKKYLIYLDILGFKDLPKILEERSGFEEDIIREYFLTDALKKKIEEIKREEIQIHDGISEITGSDNYLLIVGDIQTAFELVGKLTTIKIPHRDCGVIPLEVALGTKTIDEDIEVNPINRKEIIKFLKEDVINPYRSYYESDETIKETFVLFTQEFFDDLEPLDKKHCRQISDRNKTFFVADLEKIQQRARVFEFLEKIGYAGSKWYGRIDGVYVPPSEYEDMARTLKERGILFITGTPEYGKTYTAVRLMWEFYNCKYEPRWIKGGSPAKRDDVGEKLEDIRSELKRRHIVYFEDPFGKTKYGGRDHLERQIRTIIDSVEQVEGAYAIITSREEVFKEFEKKPLVGDLKEFKEKLNIKRSSYDYGKRKKILLNWAEEESCKWLRNEKLTELILKSIKNKGILPTPLSIKNFAIATIDIEKEDELKEKLKEKSQETAKAFAEEIKNMNNDKILFLSFMFISDYFKIEFFRAAYQELVEELNLKDAWEFDKVLNWFKDDKVDSSGNRVQFSHPSYSGALPYLLVEDGDPTQINKEIFSKLLLKLSENDEPDVYVAQIIAGNFDKLPENIRDLLFKLSKLDGTAAVIALNVLFNFDKFSEAARNELLLNLSEMDEAAEYVAFITRGYFDKFSDDVRNELLLNLFETGAADECVADYVADCVAHNFDELPDNVRNLLFKLSEIDEAAFYVALAVTDNFDNIPNDVRNKLLLILSEKNGAAEVVAEFVADNFDEFPEDVRNLLDKLQEPLQDTIKDLLCWDDSQALRLISNVLPKIDQNFALNILNELSRSGDEGVRREAVKLLKTKIADTAITILNSQTNSQSPNTGE